jgi:hypothetical protein
MKRAVSISLGSSHRNKSVTLDILGEKVILERIGTDGDMEAAARKFLELDGKVDAFGLGGADLGLMVDGKWHPFHSTRSIVRHVKHTPIVDGAGLKNTLENQVAAFLGGNLGEYIEKAGGKKALVTTGADRWGLSHGLIADGWDCAFGDLEFSLGLPITLHSERQIKTLSAMFLPLIGRLPFKWVYPTGRKQEEWQPGHRKLFEWATVIAGDCHYIKRHLPMRMNGKIVVTNTTTPEDAAFFRKCGVKYLVTTTPLFDGRSFGANLFEAALVAVSGRGKALELGEYSDWIERLGWHPTLQEL